ncbi:MAG: DNA primase [Sideroxydans sp.]
MIPKSFIQDLLNRLDIVAVIERYLPLKKAGANYVACCPFHTEKSPSFTVSQSKQFYHCFGCGAHGTAIGFIMEHTGMSFVEAVEELAKSVGMTVPHETGNLSQPKVGADLYELMQTATRYYREQLKQHPRAIAYLKARGLSGEVAARFGIGYAPEGWQNLQAAVPNYQDKSLVEAGLVITNDEGKRYDRFRDRIMFPIVNVRGQVIGFGGRVLDQGEPKYLNSPETTLFEKGRELYGLYQAQKAIRAQQRVIVVEGYMDVVALAQHGVEYAVATLGTATTPFHVQKLLRLAEQIVFCFDGDKPGQKAAWRALENALPQLQDGKRISFLFLPEEHDPDSYIREYGRAAFERELDNALPLSGYLLRQLTAELDLNTQEGKSTLLKRAQPLITAISAPAAALLLRKEVAALAGVTQAELEALWALQPVAPPPRPAPARVPRPAPSALRSLLRCLLMQPVLARQVTPAWPIGGEEGAAVRAIAEWVRNSAEEVSSAALIQHFQGTPHERLLAVVQGEMLHLGEHYDVAADFAGLLRRLELERLESDIAALESKGLAMDAAEQARYKALCEQRKQLKLQTNPQVQV